MSRASVVALATMMGPLIWRLLIPVSDLAASMSLYLLDRIDDLIRVEWLLQKHATGHGRGVTGEKPVA
ncbi:MAG: hypothetical protein JO141_22160 [Bradyrhizobium sp.]|nr:hypothetical protein [Bradyrhizobium sp.]